MNLWLITALGFIAAAINVFVFLSSSMIPLRIAAIVSSALFSVYFYLRGLCPLVFLNGVLVLVNVWRLWQALHLIKTIRAATHGDFNFESLRPFVRSAHVPAGTVLCRQGDLADEAFVIVRGVVELPELGVTLGDGAFFGEIGLFTDENRRTASVVTANETELLCIRYSDMRRLAAQNPQFGFYLMRLMM
jgi:hypothetical protein